MMTPRRRWQAILQGERPDRIVTDYRATGELDAKLKVALGCTTDEQLDQRLGIDRPLRLSPKWIGPKPGDDPTLDEWGIRYEQISYGSGAQGGSYTEPVTHPLANAISVSDIHAHKWPHPDDWDYEPVRRALAESDGTRIVVGGIYEPFLLYGYLRGMELSFEDLLLSPQIADAVLGHLFDIHHEINRRMFEMARGKIDITIVAEDLGSQSGPLMGVPTYQRFLRDGQKRMADLGRKNGARIFYHTDGSAFDFLPDLIEVVGINILDPIQWRCPGMERERLASEIGRKIIFHGAVDNQQTLSFGTEADVRREVRQTAEIFKNCRWICAPCHNIQAVSPVENVVAMYDEASKL